MEDPLTDDMIPAELMITEDCGRAVHGLSIGMNVEDGAEAIVWSNAEYSVMDGTVRLQTQYVTYTAICAISSQDMDHPSEDEADWEAWKQEYMQNPTGKIVGIRMQRNS